MNMPDSVRTGCDTPMPLNVQLDVRVAGPNGSGKSTLLNLLAGTLPTATGERSLGDTTVTGYFSQHPVDMPEHVSIIQWLR